ncbi:MAG: hypothetical protein ACYC4A_06020 [Desulfobulbia bacterium]
MLSQKNKPSDLAHYQRLVGVLYLLARLMRKMGLLSLEEHIEDMPASPLFSGLGGFDPAHARLCRIVADTFRLMLMGVENPAVIERSLSLMVTYGEWNSIETRLAETARTFLWAISVNEPPWVAAELARQVIPVAIRPESATWDAWLRTLAAQPSDGHDRDSLYEEMAAFFDSLDSKKTSTNDELCLDSSEGGSAMP